MGIQPFHLYYRTFDHVRNNEPLQNQAGIRRCLYSGWKDAGVRTKDVDGFLEFKFFRLDSKEEGYVLFSSYAVWENKEKFLAWTKSEHFRKSHATGVANREMYVEHPHLECFDVLF